MDAELINQQIIDAENNPFPDMDEATYLNRDIWFKVITGKMDLKMVQCIYWSAQEEYDATPEELYAISPDYINGRRMCYGRGKNRVTTNELFLPSPDHVIPQTRGGASTIDNLKIVPKKYNIWKRDMLKEDWNDFKTWMDQHLND